MEKIKKVYNVVLGIIIGLFVGGIYQAFPKFEWKALSTETIQPKINVAKIKAAIVKNKSLKDYIILKKLSGGLLRKEDIYYGLIMNEYHPNDMVYVDVRRALVEIYNISPRDTVTLRWIRELDGNYKK